MLARKRKNDESVDIDINLLFKRMVKARVIIDFKIYKVMKDLDQFSLVWAYDDLLCSVVEQDQLIFSLEMM